MRRLTIGLVLVVMILLFASVAGAVPPKCDEPGGENLPGCPGDDPSTTTTTTQPDLPLGGTMCDPAEYPDGITGVQTDDFTFTLEGKKPAKCIDVLSDEGLWEVTVTGEGARYLGLVPRDSSTPGDSCGGWLLRSEANIYTTHTFSAYGGPMPAATINACGTEWSEWVDLTTPGLIPEIHCGVIDGDRCKVVDALDIPHPLAFHVFMQSGGGSTTFYVNLPPLD